MQPINNKYSKWYRGLIETRRNRELNGYVENHHIIPRSLGGTDDLENLISLTPKEHFIAHLLLAKMFGGAEQHKMHFAFGMMLADNTARGKRYKPTARFYEIARKLVGEAVSNSNKGKVPWNKGIPRSDDVKMAVSNANKGKTPWNKGKKRSEEEKRKMKEGWAKKKNDGFVPHNKGKNTGPLTEEHRIKIGNSNKGKTPWNKGKRWSKKSKDLKAM